MTSQEKRHSIWWARLGRATFLRVDLALGVLVTIAGLVLFRFSGIGDNPNAGFAFLQNIEQSSLDLRFGIRGVRAHDSRIVIVGIDEKTLQNIGSFPFPRDNYARLIDRLTADGARESVSTSLFLRPNRIPPLAPLKISRANWGTPPLLS